MLSKIVVAFENRVAVIVPLEVFPYLYKDNVANEPYDARKDNQPSHEVTLPQ